MSHSRKRNAEEVGTVFGMLTVIADAGNNEKGASISECKCECGNIKIVANFILRSGNIKSCGCINGTDKRYNDVNRFFTHLTQYDLDNEQWKDIDGIYKISNLGRIFNKLKDKQLKPQCVANAKYTKGYLQYRLSNRKLYYGHRLVMEYFFEGFNKKLTVNHKNSDSYDNRITNLENISQAENTRKARVKAIEAYDMAGNKVYEFGSATEATQYGFYSSGISRSISENKSYKKLIWKFKGE